MNQKDVWESIASDWNEKKRKPWKEVAGFLSGKKGIILDAGCGSGRNFVQGNKYVGVDFSENMLKYAKQRAEESGVDAVLIKADIAALPLKASTIDSALMVATLHSTKNRGEALNEMKRVMRKGGEALITVWNKSQPRFFFRKKELLVPWKSGSATYNRYYYLFNASEIRKLLSKYFFVKRVWSDRNKALKLFPKNIIAIVRKP